MMLVAWEGFDLELCPFCGAYWDCGHDRPTGEAPTYDWLKVESDAFIAAVNAGMDWEQVEDLGIHGSADQLRRVIAASRVDGSALGNVLADYYELKLKQRFSVT